MKKSIFASGFESACVPTKRGIIIKQEQESGT